MSELKIHELIRSAEAYCFLRPILRAEPVIGEHYELVPCWHHPRLGRLEWSHVAALAEYIGLDESLSIKFLETGCAYLGQSVKANGWGPSLTVNVPFKLFASTERLRKLRQALLNRGVQPTRLRLRFSGRSYIDGTTAVLRNLASCREQGIRIAIDGLEDLRGLDRYVRTLTPEVASVGPSLSRAFALGNGLSRFWELAGFANELGMHLAAEAISTQSAYFALLQLGFWEFQGPAVGDLIPLTGVSISSATA